MLKKDFSRVRWSLVLSVLASTLPATAIAQTASPPATPTQTAAPSPVEAAPAQTASGNFAWFWWLLPPAAIGVLWWSLKGRKPDSSTAQSEETSFSNLAALLDEPQAAQDAPTSLETAETASPETIATPDPAPIDPLPPATVDRGDAQSVSGSAETPAEPEIPAITELPTQVIPPIELPQTQAAQETAQAVGAVEAAIGLGASFSMAADNSTQSQVEATKFDVGQSDLSSEELATVDEGLPDLPEGYGESRIVLMARDPQWAYVYWDVPNERREDLRRQGGQQLALRLYDATDVDLNLQRPHSLQQYACDEMTRDWYLPIPVSDRDYVAEIGYLTDDGSWLLLARSNSIRIPPVYPSDWFDDQFITIDWEEDLAGRTFLELVRPEQVRPEGYGLPHEQLFGLAGDGESWRVAGSLFGSMHQLPQGGLSSFVFPSGMGMWGLPTPSGMGMSGISGMSGVGFFSSQAPMRSRQFWLVADAELIVYGATEPDATLTIGGVPVKLDSDGTFRFQMSFQDGMLDFPIMAVAADGEQMRQVRLKFTRETPLRNTNTKDEAQDQPF